MYLQLDRHIKGIEKDVSDLRNYIDTRTNALEHNLTALRESERQYEKTTANTLRNYGRTLTDIQSALDDHQRQLNRLSNGTSNADVLDKLKETRAEVRSRLEREHEEVFTLVEQSRRNVTQQLQANNAQLSVTKQHVDTSLNQTVSYMQSVLGAASTDIRAVQRNVTTELAVMTESVQTIVHNLKDKVHDAEVKIRQEVDAVQKDIAQYVAVTNKQFAAENNFVKYQLAGMAAVFWLLWLQWFCVCFVWLLPCAEAPFVLRSGCTSCMFFCAGKQHYLLFELPLWSTVPIPLPPAFLLLLMSDPTFAQAPSRCWRV